MEDKEIIYYKFATKFGLSPKEVNELDMVLVQELMMIDQFVEDKQQRELKKTR